MLTISSYTDPSGRNHTHSITGDLSGYGTVGIALTRDQLRSFVAGAIMGAIYASRPIVGSEQLENAADAALEAAEAILARAPLFDKAKEFTSISTK